MQAHELPQVTVSTDAPLPEHEESQAPWPQASVPPWQVASLLHARLHGALVGHWMVTAWHADVLLHTTSHDEVLGQLICVT